MSTGILAKEKVMNKNNFGILLSVFIFDKEVKHFYFLSYLWRGNGRITHTQK